MGQDFVENIKHKVWLKMPLEDIELIKSKSMPIIISLIYTCITLN